MTFPTSFSFAAIIGSTLLASHAVSAESDATVTFFDVGDSACVLARSPSTQIIFSDNLTPDDNCYKELAVHADALTGAYLVNLSGQAGRSAAWHETFALKGEIDIASLTESVDRENLLLQGDTRLLSLPLSNLHPDGSGFLSKFTFAHMNFLFLSNDASDGVDDIQADCKISGWVYDPDTAYDLEADLILVPNSGRSQTLSKCFLETVSPHFAVLSAGHGNKLPTSKVAQDYLKLGLEEHNILRTDRGDDEGGSEWRNSLTVSGCIDAIGDDRVVASVSKSGTLNVAYAHPQQACEGKSGG